VSPDPRSRHLVSTRFCDGEIQQAASGDPVEPRVCNDMPPAIANIANSKSTRRASVLRLSLIELISARTAQKFAVRMIRNDLSLRPKCLL
jgi:hypothetical protein